MGSVEGPAQRKVGAAKTGNISNKSFPQVAWIEPFTKLNGRFWLFKLKMRVHVLEGENCKAVLPFVPAW